MYGLVDNKTVFKWQNFTIVTDHKPLTCVFNVKDPCSRLHRWRLKLEEFDYLIVYKPGVRNTNADALSRIAMTRISRVAKDGSEISKEERNKILQEFHEQPVGGSFGYESNI